MRGDLSNVSVILQYFGLSIIQIIHSPPVKKIIIMSKSRECLRFTLPPALAAAAADDEAELLLLMIIG